MTPQQRATCRPPAVVFDGRRWSPDEMAAISAGWLDRLSASVPRTARLTAVALSNHPESVALLFALSCLPWPVIVYPPDPRAWRSSPPVSAGTPLFLPPSLTELAPEAAAVGLQAHALPAPRSPSSAARSASFLACPGFVNFTSGSTGLPKPVYISTQSFLVQTAAIIEACKLGSDCAVAGSLQLSTHYGLGQALFLPTVLGSTLGLLERFDPRGLLALFASDAYGYWAGTPLMAELLTRVPPSDRRPTVPPICHISAGKLSLRTFHAFTARFGVKLRPNYGQTECGFITVDTSPDEGIRPESVGRASPGVEVRIGDDPQDPLPAGRLGRVWFRCPWYMEGYGFPPELAPRAGREGWWSTADVGILDHAGYLTLAGRADDCFKTSSGYLVNPGEIVQALMSHPGVTEVVVIPIRGAGGSEVGVLVEAEGAVDADLLRATAARKLPTWLQPKVLVVTDRLPRLAGGKADRNACHGILQHESRFREPPSAARP